DGFDVEVAEERERRLRADLVDRVEHVERLTLFGGRESVERDRVLAHLCRDVEHDEVVEHEVHALRNVDGVADAIHVDDRCAAGPPDEGATESRNHRRPPFAATSATRASRPWRTTWVIAIAHASDASLDSARPMARSA